MLEEANEGTLFLDEIGEMPYDLQSKLLRVLETGEFIKVGDTKSTKVNVRIIAATNRQLQEQVNKHEFREDLFYRLNVFTINLPPLRERKEDILMLATYYTQIFAEKTNSKITGISKDALEHLEIYPWRGNIRELRNVIERAVILSDGDTLHLNSLPTELQKSITSVGIEKEISTFALANAEKQHILKVLNYTNGNKTKTAELLNIALTTLYRKLDEYQIK